MAYAEPGRISPMAQHAAEVARLVRRLFQRRIEVAERRLGLPMADIVHAAAVLHDMAKASRLYLREYEQRCMQGRGETAFHLHELAAAVLILHAARHVPHADLTAHAIARHHAAMERRHPAQILESHHKRRDAVQRTRDVIAELDPNDLRPLADACNPHCLQILDAVRARHGDIPVDEYLTELAQPPKDPKKAAAVRIATGLITIADIIAAHAERRDTDDRLSKPYVRHWINELELQLP